MLSTRPADCLVVGAGPAGLTAALYLRRFGREVVVVDQGHSRALAIERTHNFPGFPQGIPGRKLLQRLREQLVAVGGEIVVAEVARLDKVAAGRFVAACQRQADETADQHADPPAEERAGGPWQARTVLLATGVLDIVPALPGIQALQQHGRLRQCPICDGYEHRGQRIVVLGDGAHAAREAAFIAGYSPHVSQAGLSEVPTTAQPGVQLLPAVARRADLSPAGGVRLGLSDGSVKEFDVAYAALKSKPRSKLGQALGAAVDEAGNLVVDAHAATSVHGLYAAGDVVQGLDQLVVAAAQGAVAATAIHNLLRGVAD